MLGLLAADVPKLGGWVDFFQPLRSSLLAMTILKTLAEVSFKAMPQLLLGSWRVTCHDEKSVMGSCQNCWMSFT